MSQQTAESRKVVRIPLDLIKKFQGENIQIVPEIKAGIIMIPDPILAQLGLGDLSKSGLAVVIVPQEEIS